MSTIVEDIRCRLAAGDAVPDDVYRRGTLALLLAILDKSTATATTPAQAAPQPKPAQTGGRR